MRRTTHFYVMLTSLCMLLLKGTRSDQAGDKGDKCVKQESYNSSLSTLDFNDLKLDLEKYNVECVVDSLHVKTIDGKKVRGSDLDDIVEVSTEHSAYHRDTTTSPSSSRRTVTDSSRHSERRIVQSANRRYARVQDIRRTDNRRDTLNRRHSSNRDSEIRRREVRGEHIGTEGRRRLGSIDRQTALRRLNLQARNRQERRTLTRGNRESLNSEELRRNSIDNMQSNTRRVNQRNSQLFERRENRNELTNTMKVRDVERRNGRVYRNDIQSNDVIRNSRQESREIRQEDNSRRSFRNIDNRRDRRDNREFSDMRIRHFLELKQGNQFRSSHGDRRVIRERHALPNEKENREIDVVVRRESRRIVNAGTKPSDRRVDNMRYVRHREISARSKVEAKSAIIREMSQIARLDDGRRLISIKRDRRGVRRYDDENMRDNSREIRTYNSREINAVRGMGYKQDTSHEHGWSIDGIGITRAIVVGFVGILGRKIWQKQA